METSQSAGGASSVSDPGLPSSCSDVSASSGIVSVSKENGLTVVIIRVSGGPIPGCTVS